jgi:hypothetical protein
LEARGGKTDGAIYTEETRKEENGGVTKSKTEGDSGLTKKYKR